MVRMIVAGVLPLTLIACSGVIIEERGAGTTGAGGHGGGVGGGSTGGAGSGVGGWHGQACPSAGVATLVSGAASSVAVDATRLYWATHDDCDGAAQVLAMPKGGGPAQTLADHQINVAALFADAQNAYWLTGCGSSHLRRVPLGGGAIVDYPVEIQGGNGNALASDGKNLYYQDYGTVGIPIAGGPQFDVDDTDYLYGLAADPGGVYWVGLVGNYEPMGVFAFPTGAPAPQQLVTAQHIGSAIALDSGWIYYGDEDGGDRILRVPRAGGEVQTVVPSGRASAMATDGTYLYWADLVPGLTSANLHKTPVDGGADEVIATADGWVPSMVLDAECLYFVDEFGGEIKAVAR